MGTGNKIQIMYRDASLLRLTSSGYTNGISSLQNASAESLITLPNEVWIASCRGNATAPNNTTGVDLPLRSTATTATHPIVRWIPLHALMPPHAPYSAIGGHELASKYGRHRGTECSGTRWRFDGLRRSPYSEAGSQYIGCYSGRT